MQLQRIELAAASLAPLLRFYEDVLGLTVITEPDESLEIVAGVSRLIFRAQDGFSGRYHFAFNVPENRLGAAAAFLRGASIPLITGESGETIFAFTSWNAHALYFYDPAGNIVEFIARHDLPGNSLSPDAPFTAAEILSVSEIGLPAADVAVLVQALTKTVGCATYGEPGPAFAAVGDVDGLFIVVREKRLWFPTSSLFAEPLPVRVTAGSGGQTFVIEGTPYRIHAVL